MRILVIIITSIVLYSCGSAYVEVQEDETNLSNGGKQQPIQPEFANRFKIDTIEGGIQKLIIFRDWGEDEYLLVPKGRKLEQNSGTKTISTPIVSCGAFSSGFIPMIDELNALNTLKVVESEAYIFNERALNAIENNKISCVKENGILNKEKLALNAPEIVFTIGFGEDQEVKEFTELGIVELPLIEWKETHPLGRAEWIKVFGALLDKEEKADSLFNKIKTEYNNAKKLDTLPRKEVLISTLFQNQWFMPGGGSYVAQFISDAGGTYPWIGTESSGSIPLSLESVISEYEEAKVWIQAEAGSIEEILLKDSRLQYFTERATDGIYHYSKRMNAKGGNDYFESAILHPERVLSDFQIMISGGNTEDLFYFNKLN